MHQRYILRYAGGIILFKRANKRYSWSTSRTLVVIILRCSKWNLSMCKRSVDIWGHLYHVLSVNSLIMTMRSEGITHKHLFPLSHCCINSFCIADKYTSSLFLKLCGTWHTLDIWAPCILTNQMKSGGMPEFFTCTRAYNFFLGCK